MQRKVVQFLVELLFCVCTYLFNQLMDFAYNTICEALKIDGNRFVSVLNTQKPATSLAGFCNATKELFNE
jgi:hypothetical protein